MSGFFSFLAKVFLALFCTQIFLGYGLDWIHQNSFYFKPARLTNDLNWKGADILILGSSRALTSFDSNEISKRLEKKVVNLSIHDTGPDIHLLMLKYALECGNKPELVILQYDHNLANLKESSLHEMDYLFLPLISKSEVIRQYFKNKLGQWFVSFQYVFPIWKYAYWNTELVFTIPQMLYKPTMTYRSDALGDYDYPSESTDLPPCNAYDIAVSKIKMDAVFQTDLSQKINSLNAKLLIVTAPTFNFSYDVLGGENYINASTWFNCQSECFYDPIHLNRQGKEKFTGRFLDTFERNY